MTDTRPAPIRRDEVAGPDEQPSIGQLVANATRDVSTLIQHEIALAKAEVKVSVKAGGVAIAMFAGAGLLLLLAVIILSMAMAHYLAMTGMPLAVGYTIVFAVYVIAAIVMVWIGLKKVRKVGPPERAIHQAQETKNTLMHRG